MKSFTLTTTLFATSLVPLAAQTTNVADFVGFGTFVTNSQSALFGFTDYGEQVKIADGTSNPSTFITNHLATDVANNRLIYALTRKPNRFTTDGQVTNIVAYNFATGQRESLLNLNDDDRIATTIGTSGGGGGFFGGSYYLFDDEGGQQGLVKIDFDPTDPSTVSDVTKPYGNFSSLGDLGDLAIDSAGNMYVLNRNQDLYVANLDDPEGENPFQLVGNLGSSNVSGQIFVDEFGRLLTNSTNSSEWLVIDPETAQITDRFAGPSSTAWFDLSEGARVGVVPEPSSIALLGLGALGFLKRRRK